MAQRRMFSLKIVDTDDFIDMPASSRLLYYDLAMRADDDGFVSSPKKIVKMTGASPDDFKVLCSKQFIFPFETGVCVIKDWKIHNYIQKDRYQETIYTKEKSKITTEENGTYTKCIQDVSISDTQVRLGKSKERIGKDSIIFPDNLNNDLFKSKYKEWITYKKEKRDKLSPSTIAKQLNTLSGYDLQTAMAIIDQSIMNGWKGLFPLKSKPQPDSIYSAEGFNSVLEELDARQQKNT